MQDDLGNRMKGQYEERTRYLLPRRTYTLIRVDGKAFHTYTKGLQRPFDKALHEDMDNAVIAMMPHLQGSVFAYTQSDEISVLLTDFAEPTTSAWFDGNLQKMCSVSASIITAEFNRRRLIRNCGIESGDKYRDTPMAYFDSRIFTIPDPTEVMNYFIWRNQDCSRNSVSMVAQSNFSHKELHGKSTANMHEMLHEKKINWTTDFSDGEKNGRLIVKEQVMVDSVRDVAAMGLFRSKWVAKGAWKFTEDKDKLSAMIPKYD